MGTDTEHFDHGQLFQRRALRLVQLVDRHLDILTHTAVGVDAEDLQLGATVGLAPAAGSADATVQVRFHRADVTHDQVVGLFALPQFDNLYAQFMAEDTRVTKKGLTAAKSV